MACKATYLLKYKIIKSIIFEAQYLLFFSLLRMADICPKMFALLSAISSFY